MSDKDKQQPDQEAKEDLRADRDDSMGYSREQFTFEETPKQPKKKPKGKAPKKTKR